jgi:hypothetical protein
MMLWMLSDLCVARGPVGSLPAGRGDSGCKIPRAGRPTVPRCEHTFVVAIAASSLVLASGAAASPPNACRLLTKADVVWLLETDVTLAPSPSMTSAGAPPDADVYTGR